MNFNARNAGLRGDAERGQAARSPHDLLEQIHCQARGCLRVALIVTVDERQVSASSLLVQHQLAQHLLPRANGIAQRRQRIVVGHGLAVALGPLLEAGIAVGRDQRMREAGGGQQVAVLPALVPGAQSVQHHQRAVAVGVHELLDGEPTWLVHAGRNDQIRVAAARAVAVPTETQQLLVEVDHVGSQFLDFVEVEDRTGHVIAHGDHDGVLGQRGKGGCDEVAKHGVATLTGAAVDDRACQKDQAGAGQGQHGGGGFRR